MNEQQQRRLAELIMNWHQVDGRSLSQEDVARLRRRILALRLDMAVADVMQLSSGTDCEITLMGWAGKQEDVYSQFSFGLRLAADDNASDGEQQISIRFEDDGQVIVSRTVVTRRQDDSPDFTLPIQEAAVTHEVATVEWFTDRLLDFIAAKVANPRPSGLPLATPVKIQSGKRPFSVAPRVLPIDWKVVP
jgi:hypothetical protein